MTNPCQNSINRYIEDNDTLKKEFQNYKETESERINLCNNNLKSTKLELEKSETENKRLLNVIYNDICDSSNEKCVKFKEEEDKKIQENTKFEPVEAKKTKEPSFGGENIKQSKFQTFLRNFENKISGGIIGQIRENFENDYRKELQNYKNMQTNYEKGVQKGGNPIVFMVLAGVKIALMTLGTFLFNWWPIMMIISLYCVYVEYKMIKLSGQDIMGVPILFLLGAYLCPCIWAIVRLFMGWTTNSDTNPKLFNIFSKCTGDGFTLNFHEYYGRDCKDNKCLWTTKQCYSTLYNKDKGLLDTMTNNITDTFNKK